ncbi:MAG TPA: hypothetical protein VFJ74_06245 [Gemmatimonadaceae bacterium]|nr:hypothetical protein [Gemmatimonadaceae bacterium]
MINHIDVSSVLRRTVCDLYSNLVTRPTGAAVRTEIEQQLAESRGRTLTVIDFTNVNLLDFSCADEIVAKLLLRYGAQEAAAAIARANERDDDARREYRESYFIFRGLHEAHLDAVEAVLERHGLALVAEAADGGRPHLVGAVDAGERATWEVLSRLGVADAGELADATGRPLEDAIAVLDSLCRRRLAMRLDEAYVALGPAVEGDSRSRRGAGDRSTDGDAADAAGPA